MTVAKATIREIMNADSRIISLLDDSGTGDISRDELLVFAVTRMSPRGQTAELMREVGIPEQTFNQVTEALIKRGYLRRNPGGPGPAIGVTARGAALATEIESGARYVRWADFEYRQGDMILSAFPKSGVTWVQMICALLVFQSRDLPRPLTELSPTLDNPDVPADGQGVLATLAEQGHRRFLKTHLPLSGIPADPRATYIFIGRHPLDVMASMHHLMEVARKEMQASASGGQRKGPSKSPNGGDPTDQHKFLLDWIDKECPPGKSVQSLQYVLRSVADAWERRDDPNVVLLHYEDLSADLEGEMRRLAARLGITVPEAQWPTLVKAATFDQMRAAAERIRPHELLADQKSFFWGGKSGAGRRLLTGAELAHYHDRAAQLAPAGMLAWLHRQD
jgi:aryl sulfotransferase